MQRKYEVIIVGAGPAGATLAYELASKGIKVLVLEKATLPRYKCCGGGITIRAAELSGINVGEIAEDVIGLVAPYFEKDSRVQIIHDDALVWKPPKNTRYNAIWHDIWDNICADNLPQMHKLHRKYGRRTDWQGSWCRGLCEMYA